MENERLSLVKNYEFSDSPKMHYFQPIRILYCLEHHYILCYRLNNDFDWARKLV